MIDLLLCIINLISYYITKYYNYNINYYITTLTNNQ